MDVTYFNVDTDLLKSDISELESELTKMKLAIARISPVWTSIMMHPTLLAPFPCLKLLAY